MSFLIFLILILVASSILTPVAKGYGERLSKGAPDNRDLQRLTAELEKAEQRLSEAERRLMLAEERLDFQEKLLSSRSTIRRDE